MKYRLPPLNALRAFEAAARHMSFKNAAEELCVTPAAISHQIRSIEEYLGIELFCRSNRTIELTEHGKRCFQEVTLGFTHLTRAMTWVDTSQESQRLVITAGPAFTTKWLVPRLSAFTELHPGIKTRVSASLALCDFVKEGVDVAIRFGRIDTAGLHVERLIEESVAPMCSPALRNADGKPLTPADLAHVPLIHDESLRMVDPAATGWSEWFKQAGLKGDATRGLFFNHADHALQAAAEGTGVVLGRRVLAAPDVRNERLMIPFGPEVATGLFFHFVTTPEKSRNATVKVFRDWLFEELRREVKPLAWGNGTR
ncbi:MULTISPECIES: transcriptional regulator GcvA [Paraburkholderia]|uniref:LysR family glycine cleavage system transcriptional activator n=3 Tax=Burkholderiaceae TaxID=119060 RepID=A0A7Z0BBR8_9BURK|nr:transcriptional regulator GcvA [Paraburkholderia bryophila]NYH26767.1 LysR family glycine cleavage system transcriptional activator [Paraburkholderia bryophila]